MKKILLSSLIILCMLGSGCKKILDKDSTRLVGEENMWLLLEDARANLFATYGLTRAALADHNAHWLYGDVRPGEFTITNRQDLKAIAENNLNASYSTVEALTNWRRWYAVINSANLFLERIGEVRAKDPKYTENNMTVDIAQIRFLRAFAYFYIVRIWGDVPLIISSHDGKFENKPREKQEKVLAFAEAELLAAAQDLPYKYSANDPQQPGNYYNESEGRWNGALARKLSAYAILTHLAAWQGNYNNVAVYSKFVNDNIGKGINENPYITVEHLTDANGFFSGKRYNHMLGFNFDWGHVDASFTGHFEELVLAAPVVNKPIPDMYLSKDSILSLFDEAGDQRFSLDTLGQPVSNRYITNFNGKYPIFSKIKVIQSGNADPTFRIYSSAIVFTRSEDILFLRAEALAVLGDRDGALAIMGMMRGLRGLAPYNEAIHGNLIDLIFKERRKELMGEGHRWYDKIRYAKIRGNDPEMTRLINNGGIYWPVSRTLMEQNPLLTQNSYWK